MTATRKILELNAFDMQAAAGLDPETADLVARRRRVFGPASMLFYARPLNLVRGEGVWLIGADGTRYLDAYNNVASVGHCHPRVVAAVSRQMATLNTHSRYLCEIVYTYAEKALGDAAARAVQYRPDMHGERKRRLVAAHRTRGHGRHRLHRDGERLSRQYAGRDRNLPLVGERRAAQSARLSGSSPRHVSNGVRGGGAALRGQHQEGDFGHEEKENPLRRARCRQHLLQRRHLPGRARIHGRSHRECAQSRWLVHCRRGAAGLRPHGRKDVGV